MVVQVLRASSFMPAARRPQVVRASVIPNGLSRRHRYRGNPCGPSLMALSPLDAFFDLSPSQLLETEEFMGLERARPMAVDFVEDRDGFQIKADIPGVPKQDIKLDVDHNVVTISAKHSSQTANGPQATPEAPEDTSQEIKSSTAPEVVPEDSEKILHNNANVLRYERYDSFQSRSFRVPKTADLATVSARYDNGVLTIDIKNKEDVLEFRRTVDIE